MSVPLRASIRVRLTAWYAGLLAAVLALYAAGTSVFFLRNLREQLDRSLMREIETVEGLLTMTADGHVELAGGEEDEDAHDPLPGQFLEVRSVQGAVLYRSPRLGGRPLGGPPAFREGTTGYSQRSSRLSDGTRIRLVSRLHRIGDRPVLVRLALSEEPLWHEFGEMVSVLIAGLPVAVGLAGFTGYAVARRALQPLDSMVRRAERITAERLNERLAIENPHDELGHLGRVFNETLGRLERSFEQLRRFTADASHELRTPLTAIRSVGEVSLQRSGDVSYYRDVIGSMLEEANRLTRLVDSLLTMSRADAGRIPLQRSETRLLELARESASLLEILAEEKGQTLSVEGDPQVTVHADRIVLRQALVNLIDNAVKYSPEGGRISVRVLTAGPRGALVEIQDSGPGIAEEHRAMVFDRFYRVDKSRSREEGGAGLGLSIAKWAVEIHQGTIELDSRIGSGCTFRIELPRSVSVNGPAAAAQPERNKEVT